VSDLVRHLASFARYAAARGEREHHDADAMRELTRKPLELARGLDLEWLGVAGYRLSYEGQTIYIDHAIDVPAITRRYECSAYGSSSLVNLMRLHGLAERAVQVEPQRRYELGPFTVTFVPSLHSKLLLGFAVPFDGELTCEHLDALSPSAYKCGRVWGIHVEVAGMSFYHQGSANLIDDAVPHGGVDVFLAGIAGRSFTRDYWPRILPRLQPHTIVASHFDDFFRPLDAAMGFSTNVNLAAVPDEVAAVSRDFALATLPLLQPTVSNN
jgi:L-ascorbate metabolism protein UlaG (beta-lactamase superfamily)